MDVSVVVTRCTYSYTTSAGLQTVGQQRMEPSCCVRIVMRGSSQGG